VRGRALRRSSRGLTARGDRGDENEADLSAESGASEEGSRLPRAHEDPGGTSNRQPPPCKGPEAPRCSDAVQVAVARATGRFGRADRILFPREYRHVRQCGRRAASACFVLWIAEGSAGRRLGISVSKRVGNAVVRNRLKRAIREWFRVSRGAMRERLDLVVAARRGAGELRSLEVAAALDEIAGKGGCCR
jgi:ribonuclease P protein component